MQNKTEKLLQWVAFHEKGMQKNIKTEADATSKINCAENKHRVSQKELRTFI